MLLTHLSNWEGMTVIGSKPLAPVFADQINVFPSERRARSSGGIDEVSTWFPSILKQVEDGGRWRDYESSYRLPRGS